MKAMHYGKKVTPVAGFKRKQGGRGHEPGRRAPLEARRGGGSTLEPPEGASHADTLILPQRDVGLTSGTVGWIVQAAKQVVICYNSK